MYAIFDEFFDHQSNQREKRQQRRDGERSRKRVLVVENFDMERNRVGFAANMSRNHRHRAELAHRTGVAQNDAIHQTPFNARQRDAKKGLPTARAQHDSGFFFLLTLRLHKRDQFARDKRKGHKRGR